jgi:hypothetical protein
MTKLHFHILVALLVAATLSSPATIDAVANGPVSGRDGADTAPPANASALLLKTAALSADPCDSGLLDTARNNTVSGAAGDGGLPDGVTSSDRQFCWGGGAQWEDKDRAHRMVDHFCSILPRGAVVRPQALLSRCYHGAQDGHFFRFELKNVAKHTDWAFDPEFCRMRISPYIENCKRGGIGKWSKEIVGFS